MLDMCHRIRQLIDLLIVVMLQHLVCTGSTRTQMFVEKLQQEKPMIRAYLLGSKKRPRTLHESVSAGGVGWAPPAGGKDEVPHLSQVGEGSSVIVQWPSCHCFV